MPVKKLLDLNGNKNQNNFFEDYLNKLFEDFLNDVPYFYKQKIIPFPVVFFWFSHRRIDKKTAKEILRGWCNLGLCEWKAYHGIRVKEKLIEEEKAKIFILQKGGGNEKQFKCK
ncbi:MAG: hypothetical protein QXS37_04170 [Candidatus Aenigmatarchaeota archaeon]